MLSDFAWFLYVCLDDFCGFGGLKGHFQHLFDHRPPENGPSGHQIHKNHPNKHTKTMRNHSTSQKNIERHGNETQITRAKPTRITQNHQTFEDNRQNPPLDLILSRIQQFYRNFTTLKLP
jgi:hypothetical protein